MERVINSFPSLLSCRQCFHFSTYSKRPLSLLTCLANISCKVLGPIGGQQACAQITYILYRVLNKIGVLFGSS